MTKQSEAPKAEFKSEADVAGTLEKNQDDKSAAIEKVGQDLADQLREQAKKQQSQ